jgi:tetratricopeptide (TPR) repeat protein
MYRELGRHPRNTRLALIALGAAVVAGAVACKDSKITPREAATQQTPAQPATTPATPVQQPTEVAADANGGVDPAVSYENVSYKDAESAFTSREYGTAQAMFTAYTEQHPQNPWGYYMLGLSAWKAGDPVQAESAFVAALDMDPRHVKSMLNLSRVLLDTDRPADALTHVQAALEVDSASTDAYRLLGRTQYALGNVDDAIDAYRKAISLDENDVWSMNNLGLIFIQQGRYQDALSPLARATQLDSTVAVFQNNLGIALERTGHVVASAAAYRAALAADSTYEKASVSLARVDGRADDPGVEPVDLVTLAQDFALQMEQWRVTPTPVAAESLVTIPKVGVDSVSKPEE